MFIQIPSVPGERPNVFREKYDLAVYIGRFSPFHMGHAHVIKKILETSRNLLILVGSARKPRTIKDPWTYREREEMISRYIQEDEKNNLIFKGRNIIILPLHDEPYNDTKWIESVQQAVWNAKYTLSLPENPSICITGSKKDDTSYYLNYFKNWSEEYIAPVELKYVDKPGPTVLSATQIRHSVFDDDQFLIDKKIHGDYLPYSTRLFLHEFRKSDYFRLLKDEFDFIRNYKRSWEQAPYPPTFLTVDAVVVQSGQILMVERRAAPGRGLLALPGGFLDQSEYLEDAVIRELREETGIKVAEPVLRGSMRAKEIFDDPKRSLRGRTVTVAYLFHLNEDYPLPEIRGGSDAAKAEWYPIVELKNNSEKIFEDHLAIINTMVARLGRKTL